MAKASVKYERKTGYTVIDYYKVKDSNAYRYEAFNKIMGEEDVVVEINTTLLHLSKKPVEYVKSMEMLFDALDMVYTIMPGEKKDRRMLGVIVGKESEPQFKIYFVINKKGLTREFFENYLADGDYFYGVAPKDGAEMLVKNIEKGYVEGVFESEAFEFSCYDALFMKRMRITKQVEEELY